MTSHETLAVFTKTLDNLTKWMDKAADRIEARTDGADVVSLACFRVRRELDEDHPRS